MTNLVACPRCSGTGSKQFGFIDITEANIAAMQASYGTLLERELAVGDRIPRMQGCFACGGNSTTAGTGKVTPEVGKREQDEKVRRFAQREARELAAKLLAPAADTAPTQPEVPTSEIPQ